MNWGGKKCGDENEKSSAYYFSFLVRYFSIPSYIVPLHTRERSHHKNYHQDRAQTAAFVYTYVLPKHPVRQVIYHLCRKK